MGDKSHRNVRGNINNNSPLKKQKSPKDLWTLQNKSVWLCLYSRVLLDLQTTNLEIPWFAILERHFKDWYSTLREDIMAMEHPRFPFHRKYVFECFMLIDHNVKNIHILAQLQVTWCYKYVNNWLVDSTHGFQPHSQFAHLFWLSARAVKFRKHICLIRNLRNKHKEFFGWKGLCWIGKIFGWFQRGSIFNPIEEIFVNLDAFPIGRPGKHVPTSLSHHLVTWNSQSWILQNITDTWYIFASPTNTQKCHQWIRVSISLGREHWRVSVFHYLKLSEFKIMRTWKMTCFRRTGHRLFVGGFVGCPNCLRHACDDYHVAVASSFADARN